VLFETPRHQKFAVKVERVLIVDPQPSAVRMLGDLIRGAMPCEIYSAGDTERAYAVTRAMDPQLIFVEHPVSGVDGYAFTKRLRRSDMACRMAPVIMVTTEATAASILTARDAGLHEFLRKPYTAKDLQRRLEAVTMKTRDWVEAVQYIGPDRRRFNSADYSGPRKRRNDADRGSDKARLQQAVRIVVSAAKSLDSDLMQVRRAINAQAMEMQRNTAAPTGLDMVALGLSSWCSRAAVLNPQMRVELETRVRDLLALVPLEAKAA
jgi:CheY-like chemotaxis protein